MTAPAQQRHAAPGCPSASGCAAASRRTASSAGRHRRGLAPAGGSGRHRRLPGGEGVPGAAQEPRPTSSPTRSGPRTAPPAPTGSMTSPTPSSGSGRSRSARSSPRSSALVIAVPVAIGVALFIAFYAPRRLAQARLHRRPAGRGAQRGLRPLGPDLPGAPPDPAVEMAGALLQLDSDPRDRRRLREVGLRGLARAGAS